MYSKSLTQGDCSRMSAGSGNRTSAPVQALDHKSNSLPLRHCAWLYLFALCLLQTNKAVRDTLLFWERWWHHHVWHDQNCVHVNASHCSPLQGGGSQSGGGLYWNKESDRRPDSTMWYYRGCGQRCLYLWNILFIFCKFVIDGYHDHHHHHHHYHHHHHHWFNYVILRRM